MRTFVIVLTAAAFALSSVVATQTPGFPHPAAPAAADASPTAKPVPAAAATVHIRNFAYVPETVTIKPGETVRFVEDDETPHTVTASDTSFDSGNLNQKDSWSHTFSKAGTYGYVCAYHPYMRGSVVVK